MGKKKAEVIVVKAESVQCDYCDKDSTDTIHVCPDHLKVFDQVASRRQKK